jgi:ArsR family metal-binding transcriptional regulator
VFVEFITLDHTRPCLAEPGKMIVVGKPSRAIDAVLPLLNALLPNVISYHPRASALVLRRKPGFITLLVNEIIITQVNDADEGLVLLDAVRDLLNQTWEQRDEIEPRNEERRAPRPLDVWELLPHTNCRQCGEATCMAFAFALLEARRQMNECPPLVGASAPEQRETLRELLGTLDTTTSVWRASEA